LTHQLRESGREVNTKILHCLCGRHLSVTMCNKPLRYSGRHIRTPNGPCSLHDWLRSDHRPYNIRNPHRVSVRVISGPLLRSEWDQSIIRMALLARTASTSVGMIANSANHYVKEEKDKEREEKKNARANALARDKVAQALPVRPTSTATTFSSICLSVLLEPIGSSSFFSSSIIGAFG